MNHLACLKTVLAAIITVFAPTFALASARTLEMKFALSADARSEFSTRVPIISAGRVLIEATWESKTPNKATGVTITLIRPDGSIATSKNGPSTLRFEYRATDQDIERFTNDTQTKWTLKILNDADANRSEITGTVRISVPVEVRTLEDTQFTLLGSGNAQEIAFNVPAPGRLEVRASWEDAAVPDNPNVFLTVSLVHPGESKIYARRQGTSPIPVDQQVSEEALDRGSRWIVRVQNDSQTKVRGRVKITFTPSL